MQPAIRAPVAVAELTSDADRFRCEPYRCVLRAGVCIERQRQHGVFYRMQPGGGIDYRQPVTSHFGRASRAADFGRCARCELGHQVLAQLRSHPHDDGEPTNG